MRITNASLYQNFLRSLEQTRGQSADALDRLTDQKRVRVGSDDPAAASRALQLRADLVRSEGYRQAGNSVQSDLQTIDATLTDSFEILLNARNLAVAGNSADDGNAFRAQEVAALRQNLLALANTQQNGRYLFAGSDTLEPAYTRIGIYRGTTNEAEVEIDNNLGVRSTVNGGSAFEGAGNVFQTLNQLTAALRGNDRPQIQALGDQLNDQIENLNVVRADVGARLQTIQQTRFRVEDRQVRLQQEIVELEDISIEEVAVRLSQSETSSNALSTAASRILGRSLFDFFG